MSGLPLPKDLHKCLQLKKKKPKTQTSLLQPLNLMHSIGFCFISGSCIATRWDLIHQRDQSILPHCHIIQVQAYLRQYFLQGHFAKVCLAYPNDNIIYAKGFASGMEVFQLLFNRLYGEAKKTFVAHTAYVYNIELKSTDWSLAVWPKTGLSEKSHKSNEILSFPLWYYFLNSWA